MRRLVTHCMLALISAGVLVMGVGLLDSRRTVLAQEPLPVSITLSGWGWCVGYREIGNVVADLDGYRIPRDNATEIEDVYLEGMLTFNTSGGSDTFELQLRGTKARSLFFLRQVSPAEDNVTADMMAEFEGTWLSETDYVASEGRILLTAPNHIGKPYLFVLRTEGIEIPDRERGGWVGNLEFMVQKMTGAFDAFADEISSQGSLMKEALGDLLAKATVLAKELRGMGIPYFT